MPLSVAGFVKASSLYVPRSMIVTTSPAPSWERNASKKKRAHRCFSPLCRPYYDFTIVIACFSSSPLLGTGKAILRWGFIAWSNVRVRALDIDAHFQRRLEKSSSVWFITTAPKRPLYIIQQQKQLRYTHVGSGLEKKSPELGNTTCDKNKLEILLSSLKAPMELFSDGIDANSPFTRHLLLEVGLHANYIFPQVLGE